MKKKKDTKKQYESPSAYAWRVIGEHIAWHKNKKNANKECMWDECVYMRTLLEWYPDNR